MGIHVFDEAVIKSSLTGVVSSEIDHQVRWKVKQGKKKDKASESPTPSLSMLIHGTR
jgi:hypothetical protein